MSGVCCLSGRPSRPRPWLRLSLCCWALLVLCGCTSGVHGFDCSLSSSLVSVFNGSTVEFSDEIIDCSPVLATWKQQGVSYSNSPQLVVVANTTVTFNLSALGLAAFGLTLSNTSSVTMPGDALGLTISSASLSAGACRAFPDSLMVNNTFALNFTDATFQAYSAQPCLITWKVPTTNKNTQYYYFINDGFLASVPRRIFIVNAFDGTSSSSPSSGVTVFSSSSSSPSSTGTGTDFASASSTAHTAASVSSPSFSTGTGTGSSSSSAIPIGISSYFVSSSSFSSSNSNWNGASINRASVAVSVAVAVIVAMLSGF